MSDEVVTALREELSRVNGLLFADDTGPIIQYIVVLAAGSVVSVVRLPVAFIAVPVVANLWLLHMMVKQVSSIKLSAYARYLESELNARLGASVYQYQTSLTQRLDGRRRPIAFTAFFVYFALTNVALWVIGIGVLLRFGHAWWAAIAAVTCIVTWSCAIYTVVRRRSMYTGVLDRLSGADST